jgi:hypothetical protein
MSRRKPFSTTSLNWLPVLNCMTVGGLPPTIRLMPAFLAFSPPAIAVSIQVPPAASNCSAKTATAADSPPEVHQWMTSASIASAGVKAGTARTTAVARSDRRIRRITFPPWCIAFSRTFA